MPHSVRPGQGGFEVLQGSLLDSILGFLGSNVGAFGSKMEVWEALLGSILGLVRVWEAKGPQGRGWKARVGPGVDGDDPQKAQHGLNLSKLEANFGPTWVCCWCVSWAGLS